MHLVWLNSTHTWWWPHKGPKHVLLYYTKINTVVLTKYSGLHVNTLLYTTTGMTHLKMDQSIVASRQLIRLAVTSVRAPLVDYTITEACPVITKRSSQKQHTSMCRTLSKLLLHCNASELFHNTITATHSNLNMTSFITHRFIQTCQHILLFCGSDVGQPAFLTWF